MTTYCDVYLGGKGLEDGQYLDNSGNVTTGKPAGGYAYYEDGVPELNGYVYDGPGFLWVEYESGEPDWAALYAAKDLTLVLKGENSLKVTRPDAAKYEFNYGDGITDQKNLTIRGDGSLTIQVNDDGIQTNPGDVIIESGTLTVNADDHGFDVNGSITVSGGTVNVTAGDEGFNVDEDITISGGETLIDAADIGLDAGNSITISGGTVDITSADVGIHSEDVVISGGTVDITSEDYDGIYADGSVDISGGSMIIEARTSGIGGTGVTISGGELVVDSQTMAAISGGSVTITGGNLELTAGVGAVVLATESMTIWEDALPKGVEVQTDAGGNFLISLEAGTPLMINVPFSAELKEDGIHLTNSPWGLKVIFAAYNTDGKMIDIQVAEAPGDVVLVPSLDGAVTAFFLNSRDVPVYDSLPIS